MSQVPDAHSRHMEIGRAWTRREVLGFLGLAPAAWLGLTRLPRRRRVPERDPWLGRPVVLDDRELFGPHGLAG